MSVEVSVVVSVGTGTESVVVPPTSVSVVVGSSCARIGSARANKAASDVRVKIFMVKGIRGYSTRRGKWLSNAILLRAFLRIYTHHSPGS